MVILIRKRDTLIPLISFIVTIVLILTYENETLFYTIIIVGYLTIMIVALHLYGRGIRNIAKLLKGSFISMLKYRYIAQMLFITALGIGLFAWIMNMVYGTEYVLGIKFEDLMIGIIVPCIIAVTYLGARDTNFITQKYGYLNKLSWHIRKIVYIFYLLLIYYGTFLFCYIYYQVSGDPAAFIFPSLLVIINILQYQWEETKMKRYLTKAIANRKHNPEIEEIGKEILEKLGVEDTEIIIVEAPSHKILSMKLSDKKYILIPDTLKILGLTNDEIATIIAHEAWHIKMDLPAREAEIDRIRELKTIYTAIIGFYATILAIIGLIALKITTVTGISFITIYANLLTRFIQTSYYVIIFVLEAGIFLIFITQILNSDTASIKLKELRADMIAALTTNPQKLINAIRKIHVPGKLKEKSLTIFLFKSKNKTRTKTLEQAIRLSLRDIIWITENSHPDPELRIKIIKMIQKIKNKQLEITKLRNPETRDYRELGLGDFNLAEKIAHQIINTKTIDLEKIQKETRAETWEILTVLTHMMVKKIIKTNIEIPI